MIGHSDMITLVSFLISTTHVFFQGAQIMLAFINFTRKVCIKTHLYVVL